MSTFQPLDEPAQVRHLEQRSRAFVVDNVEHHRAALDFAMLHVPQKINEPDGERHLNEVRVHERLARRRFRVVAWYS